MLSSKKITRGTTKDGRASTRTPHVIPSLDGKLHFVGLTGSKTFTSAYVVYLGSLITVDDVMAKLKVPTGRAASIRALLESFMRQVNDLKIGNVVEIESNDGRRVVLSLVADRTKVDPGPNLP